MSGTSSFFADLRDAIPELQALENTIRGLAFYHARPVREFLSYLLAGRGKRVRPLLVILSASFYLSDKTSVIDVSSAAELIHLASIVHDDVVDGGEIRRGYPTLNNRYGSNVAVLVGDILFAHALEFLEKHAHLGVLKVMSRAISLMCEGELEQLCGSYDLNKSETDYLGQVRKKTGALMGACCEAGGRLSIMPQDELSCLREYGELLGSAFQIIDDILDFTSGPEETGKSVGYDLSFGIVTLPLIYLLKDQASRLQIEQFYDGGDLEPAALEQIQEMVKREGCIDLAFSRAEKIIKEAKLCLEPLPDGKSKERLLGLAERVLQREN